MATEKIDKAAVGLVGIMVRFRTPRPAKIHHQEQTIIHMYSCNVLQPMSSSSCGSSKGIASHDSNDAFRVLFAAVSHSWRAHDAAASTSATPAMHPAASGPVQWMWQPPPTLTWVPDVMQGGTT